MLAFQSGVQYFVRKYCSPQWALQPARIDFYDMTFLMEGEALYHADSRNLPVEAGQVVLIRRGQQRAAETRGMVCAAFAFRMEAEADWDSCVLQWNQDQQIMHWILEFEQKWQSLDPDREICCNGIFLLILHRLRWLNRQNSGNPHVAEMRRYLEKNFCSKVTVGDVAKHMGLHPTYCGALFKKETGRSILQTLNLLRINRAAELLRYGGVRVTDVAMDCGFTDLFYFSRVFKEIMGRSPEQFIQETLEQQAP